MKVKAPKGYHWMKNGKEYKLMKHTGKFVKHNMTQYPNDPYKWL